MAGGRMSDLPDLTRIPSGGSYPMLFNKTSHASVDSPGHGPPGGRAHSFVGYTVDHHGRARWPADHSQPTASIATPRHTTGGVQHPHAANHPGRL